MLRWLVACALFFPALAGAQCYEPVHGTLLGHGDDGPLLPLRAIGFPFPFAGATWSHVHVSHNGVLYLTHGQPSGQSPAGYSDDPAVLAANLCGTAGQSPRLAPFWKDLQNLAANGGGVFFDGTRADRCVITWQNAVEWGRTATRTIQCQLFATGAIRFWYSAGMQVESGTALVGISPGGGVADPGGRDLAPAPGAALAIAYETFAAGTFDLAGRTVSFTPAGGGYTIDGLPCGPAHHADYGQGCGGIARASFYVPVPAASAPGLAGAGLTLRASATGYSVESLQSPWLPALGAPLALGDDDEIRMPLGMPLPHPGGAASSLWIGSNGTVALGSLAGLQPNAWTPNPPGLLGAPATVWCVWHDFAPQLIGSGPVRCGQHGLRFVVTWDGVYDFGGSSPSAANTLQFQFDLATGDVHVLFGALSPHGPTDFLIGYSPGGPSLDPGPLDLGSLPRLLRPDVEPLRLLVAPNPVLGRTLVFTTEHVPPAAALALQVVSLLPLDPGIDLGAFGAPGCLQSVGLGAATFVPLLRPGTDWYVVTVPNDLRLAGWIVGSQSAALVAGRNPLGVVTSNAVRSVLNSF